MRSRDRAAEGEQQQPGGDNGASELGNQIRHDATARKHASYRKPGRDGRIKLAAADVAQCRNEDEDGQTTAADGSSLNDPNSDGEHDTLGEQKVDRDGVLKGGK